MIITILYAQNKGLNQINVYLQNI